MNINTCYFLTATLSVIMRVRKNLFLKDIISSLISFNAYLKAARMSLMHQSFVSLGLPSSSLFLFVTDK